jgi:hypothetical protein
MGGSRLLLCNLTGAIIFSDLTGKLDMVRDARALPIS